MLDSLEMILTGFVLVMVVLALLWGACGLIGLPFRPRAGAGSRAGQTPASPAPPSPPTGPSGVAPAMGSAMGSGMGGVPPAHRAVLAAAVAHVTGGRPARVTLLRAPVTVDNHWPIHGRMHHLNAHVTHAGWTPPPRLTSPPAGPS